MTNHGDMFERLFSEFGMKREQTPPRFPGESDHAYKQRAKAHRQTTAYLDKLKQETTRRD